MASNKRFTTARMMQGLTQLELHFGLCGRAPLSGNIIGKAEVWIRATVGTVFAIGAIFGLIKGSAPAETIAFVAASHALLGRRSERVGRSEDSSGKSEDHRKIRIAGISV
jgi:hypothetical protein